MKPRETCFCELAPLYALDLLDDQEQELLEREIGEFPELAAELQDYQEAAMAISYSAPPLPIANDLKERLFNNLELDHTPAVPTTEPIEPTDIQYIATRNQDLNWRFLLPGVEVAIVHIDHDKREQTGFLRAEPGVRYPLHRHAAVEEIMMMSGHLVVQDQVYGAGDYIRSEPGSSHAPYTDDGCMFFFRTSLDDEYD